MQIRHHPCLIPLCLELVYVDQMQALRSMQKSHLNSVLAWYSLEIFSAWCYLTRQAVNLNFWDKPDSVDSNNNRESLFILCLASRSCVVNVLNQRTKCSTYFCKHENLNCTNSGDLQFASSKTSNLQGFVLSSLYWNNIQKDPAVFVSDSIHLNFKGLNNFISIFVQAY